MHIIYVFVAWTSFCIGVVNLVGVAAKHAISISSGSCSLEKENKFWKKFILPLILGLCFSIWYLLLFG